MKTIILSAFSPFGDYPANTTELVANKLNGKVLSGYRIHAEIFQAMIPRDDRGTYLLETAEHMDASCIICLGMGSEIIGLQTENVAVNRVYSAKYCTVNQNWSRVDIMRPYGELLELDVGVWNIASFKENCAKMGLDASESHKPSAFCCNHLMYQLRLAQLRDEAFIEIPWIFIHVPCSPESVPEPSDAFKKSGKITLEVSGVIRGLEILISGATI